MSFGFRRHRRGIHGGQRGAAEVSRSCCFFACFFLFVFVVVVVFIPPRRRVCSRSRPVVTVDVSIFLPASINITVPQCHEGLANTNCFNVSVCMRFRGRQLPGLIGEATSREQSTSAFCCSDLRLHDVRQQQADRSALELL